MVGISNVPRSVISASLLGETACYSTGLGSGSKAAATFTKDQRAIKTMSIAHLLLLKSVENTSVRRQSRQHNWPASVPLNARFTRDLLEFISAPALIRNSSSV